MAKKFPKSVRKHIREEKARIRRESLDVNEEINRLYEKFLPQAKDAAKEQEKIKKQKKNNLKKTKTAKKEKPKKEKK